MAETIPIGVIGVGQIGKRHLSRYHRIPGVRVVAVADLDEAEARRVAAEYGIDHVYADYHELLARDDIAAVDVCLHNQLHKPVSVAAMEAGKDVFCEKPIAGTYADGRAMLETARATGRRLGVQIGHLFSKPTRVAKQLVEAGKLGTPYHARSTGHRRRGRPYVDGYGTPGFVQTEVSAGGALLDMGIYHIAEILYLLDNPAPLRVSGRTYQKTAMDPTRRAESGYDVEELALGFVRLEGDVLLEISEAWAIHLDGFEGSYVVGTEGGLRLRPLGLFRTEADVDLDGSVDVEQATARWDSLADGAAYAGPMDHWIAGLQGRVPLLPTAEIALNTMLISEALYASSRLGREVAVEEVAEEPRGASA